MSEKQYHTQLNGCLYKYCGLLSLFYSHIISYPLSHGPLTGLLNLLFHLGEASGCR